MSIAPHPHPTPHCNWEHACVQAALRCICTHPQKPCQRAVTLGSQVHVSKETNSQVQNPGTARSRECPVGEPVSEVAQLCLTLCYPVDCSPPGSSLHGIFQARILEWVAIFLLQGILPTQGLNPCLLHLPHWQTGSLPLHQICVY